MNDENRNPEITGAEVCACRDYFKKKPAFKRLLLEIREKWKIYGRASGTVVLNNLTEEEQKVIGRFLGKPVLDREMAVSLSSFEKALSDTRFSGISLKVLLEAYFEEPMIQNKKVKEMKRDKEAEFRRSLLSSVSEKYGERSKATSWASELTGSGKYGGTQLVSLYRKGREAATAAVFHVCRALEILEENAGSCIRLAVLAADVTGNPHAFDRNADEGKLLLQALRFITGTEELRSAENVLSLYYAAGIRPDDISSFTMGYGIHLYGPEGVHPAYEGFIRYGEPYMITLSNLQNIVRADSIGRDVFILENQMVFSNLCEMMRGRMVSLVCTSGQVKTASLVLIDLLYQSGCRMFYAGDMDPEGIEIADRLIRRHPDNIHSFHMSAADYEKALSDEAVSDIRLKHLEKISVAELLPAAEKLKKWKKAAYQEKLIEVMAKDM